MRTQRINAIEQYLKIIFYVFFLVPLKPSARTMTPLEENQNQLFERFTKLNIAFEIFRHPPVHTVEQARQYRGNIPGAHCKNLFLKDKKQALWLLIALETAQIDLKHINKTIGAARLSFGKAELLLQVLGVTPGSVTPFALINDRDCKVNIVLDQEMMSASVLNYHPLSNDATVSITPEDLLRFIESCGHKPHIMNLC